MGRNGFVIWFVPNLRGYNQRQAAGVLIGKKMLWFVPDTIPVVFPFPTFPYLYLP